MHLWGVHFAARFAEWWYVYCFGMFESACTGFEVCCCFLSSFRHFDCLWQNSVHLHAALRTNECLCWWTLYQSSSVYVQGFCCRFKGFVCWCVLIYTMKWTLYFWDHVSSPLPPVYWKKALGLEFSCLFVIMWLMTPLYRSPSKPPVFGSFLPSAGVHCPCCLLAGLPVPGLLNLPLMQRFTALIQLHGGCSIILTLLLPVVAFILTLLFLFLW